MTLWNGINGINAYEDFIHKRVWKEINMTKKRMLDEAIKEKF